MAAQGTDRLLGLSRREQEVLELMATGLSNRAISEELLLTLRTVECHVRHIFTGLGLEPEPSGHRRVLAVLAYLATTTGKRITEAVAAPG